MNWDFKNFSQEEFACKHTGANGISLELVDKLQLMRDLYKKPIIGKVFSRKQSIL